MTGKGKVPREVAVERERRAWELRQKFWTHERIAAELGVDRSTVTKMLARISDRFWSSISGQIAAMKGDQVSQLMVIADEAMQAWESSKRPAKNAKKVTRKRGGSAGGHTAGAGSAHGSYGRSSGASGGTDDEETLMQSNDQNADPRYLASAMDALGDIRKIMGLDAPSKVAPTTPDGQRPYRAVDLSNLSDDELNQLILNLQAAAGDGADH